MGSAPSLLTKAIKDLALNEVILLSVIVALFLLAVVVTFGIKIYLHQRHSVESSAEKDVEQMPEAPAENLNRPTPVRAAVTPRDGGATPLGLRNSEPAMSKFENGR